MGSDHLLFNLGVITLLCELLGFVPGEAKEQSYLFQGPVLGNQPMTLQPFRMDLRDYGKPGNNRLLKSDIWVMKRDCEQVTPALCFPARVSSYFVYNLRGVSLVASTPVDLGKPLSLQLKGLWLFTMNSKADQEITWLSLPPGIRH
jgi:hypothetical protein